MRKPLVNILLIIILSISVTAVDFVPAGNINGRNVYDIFNFKNVNASKFYGDGSSLTGLVLSVSNYSNYTNINNIPFSTSICQYGISNVYTNVSNSSILYTCANQQGTVSSITAGTGLTGGTITSSGTIAIDNSYIQNFNETSTITIVNNSLVNYMLKTGSNSNITTIKFNLSATTATFSQGEMGWDTNEDSISVGYPYGATLQVGKETYKEVTNLDTVTITEGTPVSIVAASGNREAVRRTNISDPVSAYAYIGIATTSIAPNNKGLITLMGDVHNLNTDSFTEGLPIYVSSTGTLTQTLPTAPNFFINVGTVTVKSATVGIVAVQSGIVPRLSDLSDVDGTPINTTGQILVWNQTSRVFDAIANINNYLLLTDQRFNETNGVNSINNTVNALLQSNTTLNNNLTNLSNNLNSEITNRGNNDNSLQTNITNLNTSLTSVDSGLSTRINGAAFNISSVNATAVSKIDQSLAVSTFLNISKDTTITGNLLINSPANVTFNTQSVFNQNAYFNGVVYLVNTTSTKQNTSFCVSDLTGNCYVTLNASSGVGNVYSTNFYGNLNASYVTNSPWFTNSNGVSVQTNISNVNKSQNIVALYGAIQKDPQGFNWTLNTVADTKSTLNFDNGTLNFTISPINSYTYYIKGVETVVTINKSIIIGNTTGIHIIYITSTGALAETGTLTEAVLCDNVIVAIVDYDAPRRFAVSVEDERHSHYMECMTHLELHEAIGTRYESGLAVTNVTTGASANLNTSAQLGVTAGEIADEDYHHEISAKVAPANMKTFYSLGTAGNWSFKIDSFPVCYSGTCGYTGANGRLGANTGLTTFTQCNNGQYILTHIFAINEINDSNRIFAVTGTTCYASTTLATTGAPNEIATILSTTSFGAEVKPLYSLILLTTTTATNAVKGAWAAPSTGGSFIDYRTSTITGTSGIVGSGTVTFVGTDSTLTADGVAGAAITASGTLGVSDAYIQQFNATNQINALITSNSTIFALESADNSSLQSQTTSLRASNLTTNIIIDNLNTSLTNSKVSKAGDTMTGALVTPSVSFTTNLTQRDGAKMILGSGGNTYWEFGKALTATPLGGKLTAGANTVQLRVYGDAAQGFQVIDQVNNIRFEVIGSGGVIVPSGNVGIGTTAPSDKLTVVGNVNVTENMTLGRTIGQIFFGNGGGISWNTTSVCMVSPANTTNVRDTVCVNQPAG